ncbi:MAG: pyridoxal-dependent decarboxylase [Bacteroidota bacterium]|nr:pyridoxal-dependent decarboxylase [Bacteroidota bacterium]
MDAKEFRRQAHLMVDWMADYLETVDQYPVKSQVEPRQIFNQLPSSPPEKGESMNTIFKDFQDVILPGITHWQSPNFFAYFPSNNSYPSVLGEMLTAALGSQCMMWETSPAAAELEELTMNWLKQMTGLPSSWEGVIQDSASSSTLAAILSARERASGFTINDQGFTSKDKFRIYCSTETHSSVEKAVKIAGLGRTNLKKVGLDKQYALNPEALEQAIVQDMANGFSPMCMIATLGTTSSTAIDPLEKIAAICNKYNIWLHIDAAFAGTALLLPEYRWMIKGIEKANSFVFNPHKWMFTNFDCSAFFVKDKEPLLRTFEILPEYLRTSTRGKVNDYRDWGVQLGRRFRALKLWFVIRNFGIEGLQEKIRFHIKLGQHFAQLVEKNTEFEILAPVHFNVICFRYIPEGEKDMDRLNALNELLIRNLNKTGKIYLTHTRLGSKYTLRMVIAQTNVTKQNVDSAWKLICETAKSLNI